MSSGCPNCGEVCRCDVDLDITTGKQQTWWQRESDAAARDALWLEYVRLLQRTIEGMAGLHIAHGFTRIGSDEDIRRGKELRLALGLEVDGEDR